MPKLNRAGKNNPMYGKKRKGKASGNYKHGKHCIVSHCIDCKKVITAYSTRCRLCSSKKRMGKVLSTA